MYVCVYVSARAHLRAYMYVCINIHIIMKYFIFIIHFIYIYTYYINVILEIYMKNI